MIRIYQRIVFFNMNEEISAQRDPQGENMVSELQNCVTKTISNESSSISNTRPHTGLFNLNFSKVISFASSCSINLLLPLLNGLMLGFGELIAHELSWKFSWFSREHNKGYRIYPETRKFIELVGKQKDSMFEDENPSSNGFL